MAIQFTQYLRPHGRKSTQFIDRPQEIEDKATAVIVAGGRFEMEELMTGQASLTVAYGDGDIAHRICSNDKAVPVAVDAIVEEAYDRLVKGRGPLGEIVEEDSPDA